MINKNFFFKKLLNSLTFKFNIVSNGSKHEKRLGKTATILFKNTHAKKYVRIQNAHQVWELYHTVQGNVE